MANVNAYSLAELNMVAVIERANEMMYHLEKLAISNDDMLAFAKAQMLTKNEENEMWESLSWHIVQVELLERQLRIEDPQCESNSKQGKPFNAGFNV